MADKDLVACMEDHEMKYILEKYGKSGSKENIESLRKACKEYKADGEYKPHNRDNFYKYLADKATMDALA